MAQQRTQYANSILPAYRPVDAAKVLKSRIVSAEHLNSEVADWFKERARIEQIYAEELERLSHQTFSGLQKSGLFEAVWMSILSSTRDNSKAASSFAHKIHHDVEQPLRHFSSQPQWEDMKTLHKELETLAHTYQSNDDKLRKKSKHPDDETRAQWESQAPYLLEQSEVIDESRLGYLKNSLTTFGTIEADYSDKSLKISEKILNNVLSFEPLDELAAFAAQVSKGEALQNSHHTFIAPHASNRAPSVSESLRNSTTNHSDGFSDTYSAGNRDEPSSSTPSKLRSKVGSIFRSSKKKNKDKGASQLPPIADTPSSADRARYRSGGNSASTPTRSFNEPAELPAPTFNTGLVSQIGQKAKPPPPPARKANGFGSIAPVSASHREQSRFDASNSPISISAPPRNHGPVPEEPSYDGHVNVPATVQEENRVDERSAKPFKIDIKPDSVVDAGKDDDDVALSVIASTLRQRNTISGRGQRGRRDIQSTLFTNIQPASVEDERIGQASLPSSPITGTGESTISEVAEIPVPTSATIPAEVPAAAPVTNGLPPVAETVSSPPATAPVTADTQSLLSEGSNVPVSSAPVSTTIAGATLVHPPLPTGPGLNASIVEVVSAVVKDGNVSRAQLVGEIALNYRGNSSFANVRVSNQKIFDYISANEEFVKAIDSSKGLYKVSLGNIANGPESIGFKFISQSAEKFVPVDFSPIWRIEPNQSSLILAYKVADSFLRESPIVLHDLVISVPVEGGNAVSVLSKPHGLFSKAKQRIVWRFPQPVVVKAGFEERLVCRFMTEGPTREAAKGIEVKFRMISEGKPRIPSSVEVNGDESLGHRVVLDYNEDENADAWKPVDSIVSVNSGRFVVHAEQNVELRLPQNPVQQSTPEPQQQQSQPSVAPVEPTA
ncbi:hypothetical protein D0Z00_004074 [Geotrichum galactomycetum]|uniref:Uncharacterized protein n=1 Tax=Geotrichum galactomycetum TaxID=27317 RepID=A0ACB6UZG9_9ASCO|nr:hypothetical protein D0Z00_004074 [Geotrichum candidum]